MASFVYHFTILLLSIFFLAFFYFKHVVLHHDFKNVVVRYFTLMTHLRSLLLSRKFLHIYYAENTEYFSLFLLLIDGQSENVVTTSVKYKEFRPNAFLLWITFPKHKCNALSVELSIRYFQRLTNKGHGNFH